MNGRITGNEMRLQHFNDFYFLETLKAGISMAKASNPENGFRRSFDKLENDVNEAFDALCESMAKRIFVYVWGACLGEARHAARYMDKYIPEISGGRYSRDDVYRKSLEFEPNETHMTIVRDVYAQSGWGGTYGGKAWLDVTEGMMLYGKVSNATFIDHAVDLEHNGGNIFTKDGSEFGMKNYDYEDDLYYTASEMKRFLDYKFSADILNDRMTGYRAPKSIKISRKVHTLITRYSNIVAPVKNLDGYLEASLEWLSPYDVNWGTKEMTIETQGQRDDGEKIECGFCDRMISAEDHSHWNGTCCCEHCRERKNDNYTTCDNCGRYVRHEDVSYVDGEDESLCESCYSEIEKCEECGEDNYPHHIFETDDNVKLCESCYNDTECECGGHYHDMQAHDNEMHEEQEEIALPIDADGVFESKNEWEWIPQNVVVTYIWRGSTKMNQVVLPSIPAAKAQKELFKKLGAKHIEITPIEYPYTFDNNHFMQCGKNVWADMYIVSEGLWVYYNEDAEKWVVMTKTGLWAGGSDNINTALKIAHKMSKILDWSAVDTLDHWNIVPQETKDKILKATKEA